MSEILKMRIKYSTLVLMILMVTLVGFGQKEHLEPAKDFTKYEGVLKEYYDNVFPLLYRGFAEKPYARYTSMPSFSREYAFSVETIGNKQYLVTNSLSENYWYAKKRKKVKLLTNRIEIGNALYSKLGELFRVLAEHTKERPKDQVGLDGVIYYFSSMGTNGETKIGYVWSPNDSSLLATLVKICDDLHSLGNGKNLSKTDLLIRIEKLIFELNS